MSKARSAAALETARRLLGHDGAPLAGQDDLTGARVQLACTRISDNLRRAVGHDGTHALLTRALADVDGHAPVFADVVHVTDTGAAIHDVAQAMERHGEGAVAAALETLVASLIDLLSGLIGPDLAVSLLVADPLPSPAPEARPLP